MQALTKGHRGEDLTPWRELEMFGERVRKLMESNLTAPAFPLLMEPIEWLPLVELV